MKDQQPISLGGIFSEIESAEFFANTVHFNNVDHLISFLERDPITRNLIDFISVDLANFELLFGRIKLLWTYECDKKVLHPYDLAIAIYLYVLYRSFNLKVQETLEFIYENKLNNLWWTYYIYNFIVNGLADTSSSICSSTQIGHGEPKAYSMDLNITYTNRSQ